MSEDQFTELLKYIVDMDKRLSKDLAEAKSDVRGLYDTPSIVAG
jgi:hypothetical protein